MIAETTRFTGIYACRPGIVTKKTNAIRFIFCRYNKSNVYIDKLINVGFGVKESKNEDCV